MQKLDKFEMQSFITDNHARCSLSLWDMNTRVIFLINLNQKKKELHIYYNKEVFIFFKIYLQITFKKGGQIQNTTIIH